MHDDKNNDVTLGDALATLGKGAHLQSLRDAKWHLQIISEYPKSKDTQFAKILENLEDYKAFWVSKDLIWTGNSAGVNILCIP